MFLNDLLLLLIYIYFQDQDYIIKLNLKSIYHPILIQLSFLYFLRIICGKFNLFSEPPIAFNQLDLEYIIIFET